MRHFSNIHIKIACDRKSRYALCINYSVFLNILQVEFAPRGIKMSKLFFYNCLFLILHISSSYPKLSRPKLYGNAIPPEQLDPTNNATKRKILLAHNFFRARVDPPATDMLKCCQVIYFQFGLAIHQNDHQARRRFVEWAQNEIAVVPDFHKRILFSDEAHFWLNGYVNKQNCRIWSEANPQVYVETSLHPEKLTELWFQQDGATCHTARATIDLLKDTFGDRLISRFGPVNWPPRSCDLTPLDYFLRGYVKSLVYADKPQTLDHLEDNIRRVIADIRQQMLGKVIENWTSRLDYIRVNRGSPLPEIIFKV
ncbi:histone-lysine N-methyltransferase SETMAR [Trichonephila clavipes]|nr:histone-lysine N-methyltransferase SETMAR [Trichonephila clavipes]